MSYQPAVRSPADDHPNPNHHIVVASQNFWAGYNGQKRPPPPSLRMWKGKMRLGRYIGPYECQALTQDEQSLFAKWYTEFFISIGIGALFSAIDFVFIFVALPIFIVWYLAVKLRYWLPYNYYWKALQEVQRTGKPVWRPYDKTRLKLMDRNPLAYWP